MEERNKEQLDELMKKVMVSTDLETPSDDFLVHLMDRIEQESRAKIHYEPLISNKIWCLIGAIIIVLIKVVYYNLDYNQDSWFAVFNDTWTLDYTTNLPEFQFSNTTIIATIFLALMLCLQVGWLKQYYNKRIG